MISTAAVPVQRAVRAPAISILQDKKLNVTSTPFAMNHGPEISAQLEAAVPRSADLMDVDPGVQSYQNSSHALESGPPAPIQLPHASVSGHGVTSPISFDPTSLAAPVPVRPILDFTKTFISNVKRVANSEPPLEPPASKIRKLDASDFTHVTPSAVAPAPGAITTQAIGADICNSGVADSTPFKAPSTPVFRSAHPPVLPQLFPFSQVSGVGTKKPLGGPLPGSVSAIKEKMAAASTVDAFRLDELCEEFLKDAEINCQMLATMKKELDFASEKMKELSIEMLVHNNEMLALQADTIAELGPRARGSHQGEE